jgi:hypothetical protein
MVKILTDGGFKPMEKVVSLPAPKFSYRPNGTYVLIELIGTEDRKVGMIHVPGNAQMTWLTAKVLETGPKCEFAKVGQRVLVAREGMVKVQHDGSSPVHFTLEDKILAVVSSADLPAAQD